MPPAEKSLPRRSRSIASMAFFCVFVLVAAFIRSLPSSASLGNFFPARDNERVLQLRGDQLQVQTEPGLRAWIEQATNLLTSETGSKPNEEQQQVSSKNYSYPAETRNDKTERNSAIHSSSSSSSSSQQQQQQQQQQNTPKDSQWTHSKESLGSLFSQFVEQEVHFNNWNLGCNDLQFLAPYIKAIMDRFSWDQNGRRKGQLIFDVGANNGDDAVSILGSFQPIRGMCWRFGTPISLFSIEPSPKVFCEMTELMDGKAVDKEDQGLQKIHLLNVALSDNTGSLTFQDPGNEGGRLIGSNYSSLDPMTPDDYSKLSQCSLSSGSYQNQSVNYKRHTQVPTYTLDLLLDSLDGLGKVNMAQDRIFVVKVDTEGHDNKVLLGAKQLLLQKKIEFVIFETSRNHLLKSTVEFMDSTGYECYIISPRMLVPVHAKDWWYQHLKNYTGFWWGNCVCGIRGSQSMAMLWRMYHSDHVRLANSYEVMHE